MNTTALSRYYYEWIGLEDRAQLGSMYVAAGWYVFDRDIPDAPHNTSLCICFCRNRALATKIRNALNGS
jgi:hypothetical protein